MPKKKKNSVSTFQERILSAFSSHPTQAMNYKQVARRLNITQTSKKKQIGRILYELLDKGQLIEEKPGKFKLEPSYMRNNRLVGKIDMTTAGTAYVIVENLPEDIYIAERNLSTALHGDIVELSIIKVKRSGKAVGKVEKVIERAQTEFVGTIAKSLKYAFLVPDSKRMPVDIYVPLNKLKGAENGVKAIVRMNDWPEDAESPFGEVIEILGTPGENETEMHAILAEFGLPYKFRESIEREAKQINVAIKEEEVKKRRDFRSIPTFTIDPEDAKDFDDALSIKTTFK